MWPSVRVRQIATSVSSCAQSGADVRSRLRIHDGLQHAAQEPAHELAAVGGAEHLDRLEQGGEAALPGSRDGHF